MTTTNNQIEVALQKAGEPTTVPPEIVALDEDRVTTYTPVKPEEFLITLDGTPCFPRCDVSVFTGVSKTGKTFVTSMLMACCAAKKVLSMERNTDQQLKVLWIDTEQSVATTKRILKERVARMIGEENFKEELFYIFNTRRRTPQERRDRLALAIETYRPDIVIIDGIADLADDINSGTESTDLMQQLLSLAQEYECNITANIHLNRSGDKFNLRGWLGTLMLQKSYEVFTCEKMADGKTFAIEMLFSRLHSTDASMFYRINEQGLPYLTKKPDNPQRNSRSQNSGKEQDDSKQFNPEYVDQNATDPTLPWQFRKLFDAAFGTACMLGYDELERRIMELGWIKHKTYYSKVLTEAEKLGIVKKTLTKGGRVGVIIFAAS